MVTPISSELFRYVRVRGLRAGSLEQAAVASPPSNLPYNLLAAASDAADTTVGLKSTLKAFPVLLPPSPDIKATIALGKLINDKNSTLEIIRLKAKRVKILSTKDVAWLWDSLGIALIDKAKHADSSWIKSALRANHLLEISQSSAECEISEENVNAARRLVFHLPVVSNDSNIQAQPPEEKQKPRPNDTRGDIINEIKKLRLTIEELEQAPKRIVERPLPDGFVIQASSLPDIKTTKKKSNRKTPGQPAAIALKTAQVVEADISNLTSEAGAIVEKLGGKSRAIGELIRLAEKKIATLSAELVATGSPKSKIVLTDGGVYQVEYRPYEAAWTLAPDYSPRKCTVRVQAVAEFLRVEQNLKEYQAGELAHIENILQGEMKERLTRSLTRSEQTIMEETEREETVQKDSQTTDRFEMEKETQKALSQTAESHGGISASISSTNPSGTTIMVAGDLGFSSQSSKEEQEKSATKFSQSVTNNTLNRVRTRVTEQRTTKLTKEFEDTSKHILDNRSGNDHVVGAFRWVDKIFTAKLMNYGSRVAIEILVENPASFLRTSQAEQGIDLPVPLDDKNHPFGGLSSASALTSENYAYFAGYYGADVAPPPANVAIVSAGEVGPQVQAVWVTNIKGELEIPEGYVSEYFQAQGQYANPWQGQTLVTIYVGDESGKFTQNTLVRKPLKNFTGKVAYVFNEWGHGHAFIVSIECKLTEEARRSWQLKAYSKIKQAYELAVQAAKQTLAQKRAQQGIVIAGRNPLMNEQLVATELKKAAISALCVGRPFWLNAHVHFACEEKQVPLPRLDENVCNTLKLASFLESVVDWKLMTYQLLPYYWGNACNWRALMGQSDVDPLYADFLRAGAARLVVPVAEGSAACLELMYFIQMGRRWPGSEPPPLVGDFSALAAYIESEHDETGHPSLVGASWEIRVPTTLTVLECGSACVDGSLLATKLVPQSLTHGVLKGGDEHSAHDPDHE